MEATKKQKFIYSIWAILVVFTGVFEMFLGFWAFVSWSNVIWGAGLWLIPVFTTKHKKEKIRFFVVLWMRIVAVAVTLYAYSASDWQYLNVMGLLLNVMSIALMIWAVCVCKQVVEKSVLAKAGIKVAEPVNKSKAEKKAANEWVKNQQKKQPVKRLDLDEMTAEALTAAAEGMNATSDDAMGVVTQEKASAQAGANTTEASQKETVKKEAVTSADSVAQSAPAKLDINRCTQDEFLTLPGMSLISAKRAVEIRETQGDYQSVDDFVARNAIKPHFMVQMQDLIMVVEKKSGQTPVTPKKGRALDL